MDRNVTESWLEEGRVYDNFVGELAKTVEKQQNKENGSAETQSDANVDVAALTRAAKEAFPPAILQQNVESILDSAYDWLEGKTDSLVFNLDLSEEKTAFVEALGNEAVAKLSSLPTCTSEQVSEDLDPFSATCLPSGTDINSQVAKLKTELSGSEDVLPDTSLSADDIKVKVNGEDKTLDEAFSDAPRWFGWFKSSPLVLSALILVNGALIVVLSRPKLNGFKKLAWLFGPIGAVLMLIGGAGALLSSQLSERATRLGDGSDGMAENLLGPLAVQVNKSFSKWHLVIGGAYLALGLICMIVYMMQKKKNPEVEVTESTEKKVVESKEEPKSEENEAKKPPLVQ